MKDPFVHKTRVSVIQMFKDKIKKNQRVVMLKKMLPERNDKTLFIFFFSAITCLIVSISVLDKFI